MRVLAYCIFVIAFFSYGKTVQAIWQLVAETRALNSGVQFNRFWWMPAWKVHRAAYSASPLRRSFVIRFAITFALLVVSMACIALSILHNSHYVER